VTTAAVLLTVLGLAAGTVLLWRLPTPGPADRPTELLAAVAATSVVVPARDEQDTLPVLLASLAAQDHVPLEVIVVDDGSADATATVAAEAGATVVVGSPPPPGWLGKPWACAQGVDVAAGTTLVLLDADVALAPDGLLRLLATQQDLSAGGLLSVQPFHEPGAGVEQLSALANVVPVMASGMAAPSGPAVDGRACVAFGPCLVTTAAALAAVGGFAACRTSVTEDVALARAYRGAQRPVRCIGGGATVRFRMYPGGGRTLVQGWTKNLAAGAGQAPLLPTVGATAWVAALVAVAVAGIGQVAAAALGGGPPSPLVVAAWAVTALHVSWALRKVGAFRWWCAALFLVPLAAFVLLFLRSLALRALGRPVTWRGRRIRAGELVP
jgi:glycosyltransferase involved in cell wall biosynthesis